MATYPDLPTSYGADPELVTRNQIDRAEDGTARVRNYGNDKVRIKLVHPFLTAAQKSTLDSFYTTNRLLTLSHVSKTDSVTRTCVFAMAPQYKREAGEFYTATVLLEEV